MLSLLEGQRSVQGGMAAGKGDHYLGRLASDVGIQKLLAGRELVPVLRACPQLDGPHQHNGNGCWYVRLQRAAGDRSPAHEAGDAADEAEQQGQAEATAVYSASLPVEIVHVALGLAVVSKPAGLSTEALVAGLTDQMRSEMGCEPGYEIQVRFEEENLRFLIKNLRFLIKNLRFLYKTRPSAAWTNPPAAR